MEEALGTQRPASFVYTVTNAVELISHRVEDEDPPKVRLPHVCLGTCEPTLTYISYVYIIYTHRHL